MLLRLTVAVAALASARALQLPSPAAHARCAAAPAMLLGMGGGKGDVPRTVGEAKAAFQKAYGKPVTTLAQGFVNEMITSVTLATVSPDYKYSRVFAVGFEALCESFLMAVQSEATRKELRECMCTALELDGAKLQADANALTATAASMSEDELLASPDFVEIATGHKYSYPFGAGLLTLMPMVDAAPNVEVIGRWTTKLSLSTVRLEKDWMFFEKALQQMADGRQMMMEMQASAKRKEAKALKEKADAAAAEADKAEAAEQTPAPAESGN